MLIVATFYIITENVSITALLTTESKFLIIPFLYKKKPIEFLKSVQLFVRILANHPITLWTIYPLMAS